MSRKDELEAAVVAGIRTVFADAAAFTTAEEVQAWLYDHENVMPFGVRKLFFAAANAAVTSGAYEYARDRAQHQGDA